MIRIVEWNRRYGIEKRNWLGLRRYRDICTDGQGLVRNNYWRPLDESSFFFDACFKSDRVEVQRIFNTISCRPRPMAPQAEGLNSAETTRESPGSQRGGEP